MDKGASTKKEKLDADGSEEEKPGISQTKLKFTSFKRVSRLHCN